MCEVTGTDGAGSIGFTLFHGSSRTGRTGQGGTTTQHVTLAFGPDSLSAHLVKSGDVWSYARGGAIAPGPAFRRDDSTLIGSATFINKSTGEEHVVEFSIDCQTDL